MAQLVVLDSEENDFIQLRDILKENEDLLEEYNNMKKKHEGRNMDEYRKEKEQFFQKLRERFL